MTNNKENYTDMRISVPPIWKSYPIRDTNNRCSKTYDRNYKELKYKFVIIIFYKQ